VAEYCGLQATSGWVRFPLTSFEPENDANDRSLTDTPMPLFPVMILPVSLVSKEALEARPSDTPFPPLPEIVASSKRTVDVETAAIPSLPLLRIPV